MTKNPPRGTGKNHRGHQQVAVLITCLLLLLFLGGYIKFWNQFRGTLLTQPQSFLRTSGTIISSRVDFQPGGKTSPSWRPRITYSYKVGGKIYFSHVVNFDWVEASSDPTSALRVAQAYTPTQKVTVFYLPGSPAFSVLNPAEKGTTPYLFVGLSVITACCVVACIHSIRALRKPAF